MPYKGCVKKDFVAEVTANRGQSPRRKASAISKPSLFRGELFRGKLLMDHQNAGIILGPPPDNVFNRQDSNRDLEAHG